jgi:ankyrin repeat protein
MDDINLEGPDDYGRTPLWWVVQNGHEGALKILLERDDVNPDKPNTHGRTPFWCAAEDGQEGVVKYYSSRTTSTQIYQITTAGHYSDVLPRMGTMEW